MVEYISININSGGAVKLAPLVLGIIVGKKARVLFIVGASLTSHIYHLRCFSGGKFCCSNSPCINILGISH